MCLFVYLIILVSVFFILYACIENRIQVKREKEEWHEFVYKLTPGSVWRYKKEFVVNLNPFEKTQLETVTVLETKNNVNGDLWVRIDNGKTTEELSAEDFKNLFDVLVVSKNSCTFAMRNI